jgi:hypothetical protein
VSITCTCLASLVGTRAFGGMNDNVYVSVEKKSGKLLQIVRVEVAADRKTLTVTQTGNVDNVVTYERQ